MFSTTETSPSDKKSRFVAGILNLETSRVLHRFIVRAILNAVPLLTTIVHHRPLRPAATKRLCVRRYVAMVYIPRDGFSDPIDSADPTDPTDRSDDALSHPACGPKRIGDWSSDEQRIQNVQDTAESGHPVTGVLLLGIALKDRLGQVPQDSHTC